jgi:DNA-binding MarR family transcriptional regulator
MVRRVPNDAEITFADHAGRYYAHRYAFAPMVGRLIGYLLVCDPPEKSIGDLAEELLASRSAMAGAVNVLETMRLVRRRRPAGERMDRVSLDMSSPNALGLDPSEYADLGKLAREGLDLLSDAPPERRATLAEMAAFADFLVEQMPKLQREWQANRSKLIASVDRTQKTSHAGGKR